jgi:hypothetical protein
MARIKAAHAREGMPYLIIQADPHLVCGSQLFSSQTNGVDDWDDTSILVALRRLVEELEKDDD